MISWETEAVDLIKQGHFQIADPGPLHRPIHEFSLSRDDDLALVLETEAPSDAKSAAVQYPSGTIRLNTDEVKLVSVGGSEAVLTGVQLLNVSISHGAPHRSALRERVRVHQLTVTRHDPGKAAYAIEWLENLPMHPFMGRILLKLQQKRPLLAA